MRKIFIFATALFAVLAGFTACVDDDSNSVLNDFENEYGKNTSISLEYDTVRSGGSYMHPFLYSSTAHSAGETISLPILVKYAYPERLKYTWMVVPYKLGSGVQQVLVGNKLVYASPDTISHERDLEYTFDLEPNTYQFYLVAEDTITGLTSYYQAASSLGVTVAQEATVKGLYLLSETTDGNTDIEVFSSDLMLIYSGLAEYKHHYSSLKGKPLPGKPLFIRGCSDGGTTKNSYMVATDKNMYRLNAAGLVTMDEWKDMFYEVPETYNPQTFFYYSSSSQCEYLINDGKLHTLYLDKANNRKFSAPIAGDTKDYEAMSYLMVQTKTSWGHVTDAIDADQVLVDAKNLRFIPYYSRSTSTSSFKATDKENAVVDANQLPAKPMAVLNGENNNTYTLIKVDGAVQLYRFNFYNRVDNGDLGAGGSRAILDLSGCEDLENATMFATCTAGSSFYYSSGKNVYSFSPQTGQTDSRTVYTCEGDEVVTCVYAYGSAGGGWPTSTVILWIATWSESKQDGKLIQYEVEHSTGLPNTMWGPMFGAPDNPVITTGWGKIKSMTCIDAE